MRIATFNPASALQITVTATATSLKDLIQTADVSFTDAMFKGTNAVDFVELQPVGNISISNESTPTATVGTIIYKATIMPVSGVDARKLKMIRIGTSDIKVNILRIGRIVKD